MIALVYGETWLPAAPVLVWLCLGRMITEFSPCYMEVMVAAGQLQRLSGALRLRAAAGFCAFSIGACFGLQEAAMSRVLEGMLNALMVVPLVRAATGLGWGALGRCWGLSAAAAILLPPVM